MNSRNVISTGMIPAEPGHVVLFVGAGFSHVAGSPLAKDLFHRTPPGGSVWARELVRNVEHAFAAWSKSHPGMGAEEFMSDVYARAWPPLENPLWRQIVKYIGLRLAADFATWSWNRGRLRPSGHSVASARVGAVHSEFWDAFFGALSAGTTLTVMGTNYDIWCERGIRPKPTPRRHRPGFHYFNAGEALEGGPGYPVSKWLHPVVLTGSVPLLKLHGSLSWSTIGDRIEMFSDCRPAFRGDAAIVPPLAGSDRPTWLKPIWDRARQALREAAVLIVVGYSFPAYDEGIRELLRSSLYGKGTEMFVASPSSDRHCARLAMELPGVNLHPLPALPEASRLIANELGRIP